MTITSSFLEGVAGELASMSARLSVSACSGFKALDDASSGLDGLSVAWSGPRPVAVHGLAAAYVAETRAVPAAIGSACDTVSRWSMSAAVCASALAAAEAQVARLGVHALVPGATDETRVHLSQAITAIDELDVLWCRLCASFSEELSAAVTVIDRANATTFSSGGPWGFRADATAASIGSIITTWLDLPPAARITAAAALTTAWSGSQSALNVLIAALEEVQRRTDESWNAIVEKRDFRPATGTPTVSSTLATAPTRPTEAGISPT